MNTSPDPIQILLVEDNPGDAELTQRALRAGEFSNQLTIASSGADALAHLRRFPGEAISRTQLILLDLNLPDMSGFDLLASLRADSRLRRIPVVVMTSSLSEADVVRSYEMQASGYVVKPFDPADFARAVLGVEHYWHSIVRLPLP